MRTVKEIMDHIKELEKEKKSLLSKLEDWFRVRYLGYEYSDVECFLLLNGVSIGFKLHDGRKIKWSGETIKDMTVAEFLQSQKAKHMIKED